MTTKTSNVYTDLADYFEDENRGWCVGSMLKTGGENKASACLVGGVRAIVGAAYLKPNGQVFLSKDKNKWRRASRLVERLAEVAGITPTQDQIEDAEDGDDYYVTGDYTDVANYEAVTGLKVDYPVVQAALIGFNDDVRHTPAEAAKINAAREAYSDLMRVPFSKRDAVAIEMAANKLYTLQDRVQKAALVRKKRQVIKLVRKTAALHPND